MLDIIERIEELWQTIETLWLFEKNVNSCRWSHLERLVMDAGHLIWLCEDNEKSLGYGIHQYSVRISRCRSLLCMVCFNQNVQKREIAFLLSIGGIRGKTMYQDFHDPWKCKRDRGPGHFEVGWLMSYHPFKERERIAGIDDFNEENKYLFRKLPGVPWCRWANKRLNRPGKE